MPALQVRSEPALVVGFLRLVGAALLAGTGGIHLHLWVTGYRDIAWIGPLFLANAVLAGAAALLVLLAPRRRLPLVCAAGALLQLGTLGGLLLSTTVGLLGFYESWQAPLAVASAVVEATGAAALIAAAVAGHARSGTRQEPARHRR